MTPVSLIITSYNREQYLATTIESVLSQTYENFELLIWDDGSTDSSLSLAQSYAVADSRIRVEAASHQGLSKSLYDAVAATINPYLGWVDSDDLLAPTALEETVNHLDTYPSTGMVYTNHLNIDVDGNILGLNERSLIPYSPRKLLVSFMTFHFRLIRRCAYQLAGGVNPTFGSCEDYDLCLRLSEVTKIDHLKRPLYFYRRHADTLTNNEIEILRWTYKASQDALKRRGLAEKYEIKLNPTLVFRRKPTSLPLVSIIVTTYNSARTLKRCLESCFVQTYGNLEIIVVDNNSTDGTLELLQHISDTAPLPFRYTHCAEQGQNYAHNHGFLQAKGEYIQWLDSDDELTPRKIAKQITELEKYTAYDIAYGSWRWRFYDQQRLTHQLTFAGRQYDDFLLQLLMDNWRPPHAYLLRREAAAHLQSLLAWNPKTTACTDREYYTLAAIEGFKFLYVDESNVLYNGGLGPQVTRSTSYPKRVDNISRMFQRFQQHGQKKAEGSIEATHQFLLTQNLELWKINFLQITHSSVGFWIQHRATGEKVQVRDSEVAIVRAWLVLPGAFTLEDHARRIVQHLWREVTRQVAKKKGLKAARDQVLINRELFQAVGLRKPIRNAAVSETAFTDDSQTASTKTKAENLGLEESVEKIISPYPLYAPIFSEQRLRVHSVLDQFRQLGWLTLTK